MSDFTPVEHELLVSLYRAKGRVVPYEELMDDSGVISRKALQIAISRLRKKIDRQIKCHGWFGYFLC
jgi:DNA-binding response OmpR family regulator